MDHPPDYTPAEEAIEVRPWRPGEPEAEILVYPHGDQPLLWIYAAGAWRRATVDARHRYPHGTAYQVTITVNSRRGAPMHYGRTYRWGTPAIQTRRRRLTDAEAQKHLRDVLG